jgi:signal transduction histidine kinase
VGRLLSPYQELLTEAGRVGRPGAGQPEDRFLIETFRDTVARFEASQAALRQRADDLEVLADVLTREAASGVVVTDAEGRIRAANRTAEELLAAELAPGIDAPPAVRSKEARLMLAGRNLEVAYFPLRTATGAQLGEVVFLTDRTRLEVLERALQEREHMATLGELAAGMAHEVRNALATIRGFLWLLPGAGADDRARYLQSISAESTLVEELLERFLAFAQPQALRREMVGLDALVDEVVGRLEEAARGVRVHRECDAVRMHGDPLALGVAVENLLRNAYEAAAQEGGEVWVRVEGVPGGARVTVEDNGPGVSGEVAGRLFQPFVTTKASGGLGLALARRFIRLHGGEIVHRQREGGGACFEVHLPLEVDA